MRRSFAIAGALAIMTGLFVGPMAGPARASWAGGNCYKDNHLVSDVRRMDAHAYGYVAVQEGYEWGGGCWNDNCCPDRISAYPRRTTSSCALRRPTSFSQ